MPPTKATVLDPTQPAKKEQSMALGQNYKAVKGCILSFKMPEIMNKIIEKQAHDLDWLGGKFTRIWNRTKEGENPDDDMSEFELDKDLRKITLSRKKDPTDLLAKILAVEIKFGITIGDKKKMSTILYVRKKEYAQGQTITSTSRKPTAKREATPKEIVVVMYKQ